MSKWTQVCGAIDICKTFYKGNVSIKDILISNLEKKFQKGVRVLCNILFVKIRIYMKYIF